MPEENQSQIKNKTAQPLAPQPQPKAQPQPAAQPKAQPQPTAQPKAQPQPTAQPKAQPQPAAQPKAQPQPTAQPKAQPQPAAQPKAQPQPTAQPKAQPQPAAHPKAQPQPAAQPKAQPQPAAPAAQQRSAARPLKGLSPEVAKTIAQAFAQRQASQSAAQVLGQQPSVAGTSQSLAAEAAAPNPRLPFVAPALGQPPLAAVGTLLPPPAQVLAKHKPLKVAFAGGGTGGHLYPALAVAEVLRQNGIQTLFFDSYQGIGSEIVGRLGYNLQKIHAQGLGGNLLDKLLAVGKTALGFVESLYHLLIFKPSIVVASGGYVSAPVALAAACLDIPILLMEQNAFLGKSAKFIAYLADKVCLSWPGDYSPAVRAKAVLTGNPVRMAILLRRKAEAKQVLHIPAQRRCVVVMGGSQGASSLNKAILAALPSLVERELTLIHLTGPKHIEEVKLRSADLVSGHKLDYRPLAYSDDMAYLYAVADLVVCRSGATTLAEITARGLPSILVPYPYAAENHQEANARILESKGAAQVILDNQVEAELGGLLLSLLEDQAKLAAMVQASATLGRPEATEAVITQILEVIYKNRTKALAKKGSKSAH